MTLKRRFLNAIINGELGSIDDQGIVVTMAEFKAYFKDINTRYVTSFLPAATIEVGQRSVSHTKFVFRIQKGVYRVHPDAIETHRVLQKSIDRTVTEAGFNESGF